jgi:hypothetical protein
VGKIILLVVIIFFVYQAVQLYKKRNEEETDSNPYKDHNLNDIVKLEKFFKLKIEEIEQDALHGVKSAQDKLKHFTEQLDKLSEIKNNLNKKNEGHI